jgi:RNA polymerase sigma-70 factor (ECF subfamily)
MGKDQATHVPEDLYWVRAALDGDRSAFGALVSRHHRRVLALAALLVKDPDAAEDIAQESFLRAYRGLGTCEHPERFAQWITGIARNCAREWNRNRAPARTVPEQASEEDTAALEEREARLAALERALAELSDEARHIVRLKYRRGLTCAEIARELGRETNTIAKILSRAYEKLGHSMVEEPARISRHKSPETFTG